MVTSMESPQVRTVIGNSVTLVWIAVPSLVSQMMKVLFSPRAARNLSSGLKASTFTLTCMPLRTAMGSLVSKFQRIIGASGSF